MQKESVSEKDGGGVTASGTGTGADRGREDRMRGDERQIGKDAGTKLRVAMCAH